MRVARGRVVRLGSMPSPLLLAAAALALVSCVGATPAAYRVGEGVGRGRRARAGRRGWAVDAPAARQCPAASPLRAVYLRVPHHPSTNTDLGDLLPITSIQCEEPCTLAPQCGAGTLISVTFAFWGRSPWGAACCSPPTAILQNTRHLCDGKQQCTVPVRACADPESCWMSSEPCLTDDGICYVGCARKVRTGSIKYK